MWTLTFFAVVLVLWLLNRKKSFSVLKEMGVPGPEPNILFGNILELVWKTPIKCHEEWLKKYGNILGYYLGSKPVVLIADVELLKQIQVSDFLKFINRPNLSMNLPDRKKNVLPRAEGFSEQLIAIRDKKWKEIRSIITPTFTASKMKQMAPIMNNAIDTLEANMEKKSGQPFDIYPMYQGFTMDVIMRTAFGIQTDCQNNPNDLLLRSFKLIFSTDMRNLNGVLTLSFPSLNLIWTWLKRFQMTFMNKGKNPINELIQLVKEVISTRRNNKESRKVDFLQLMIDAEMDDTSNVTSEDLTATGDVERNEKKAKGSSSSKLSKKMTDEDILDNSVLFIIAGYETTSAALAFTTHLLIQHPETQEKIRQEVKQLLEAEGELDYYSVSKLQFLDQVLQESLRLYPPIYLFVSRECGEDFEIGNIKLKKGTAIQAPTFYLHRNPELWGPDVNEFNPERFSPENKSKIHPMAFQAFGQGPRNCVGMRMAYMEAKLALARLLSKYQFQACEKTEKDPLTLRMSTTTLNPKRGMWTKVVKV